MDATEQHNDAINDEAKPDPLLTTGPFDGDDETISHAVRLHKKRKEALSRIFHGMGMDLGTGIRMVVYKWLDEWMRGRE